MTANQTDQQSAVHYETDAGRDRHADPRRPELQRQHHERALPGVDGRGRGPAVRRAGAGDRGRHHQRQEDLLRRRRPQADDPGDEGRRAADLRDGRVGEGRPASARDVPAPGRGRDQRRRTRRWPRDRPRLQPPDLRRRPQRQARPPRGQPRPAAGWWRRHPDRADARTADGADGRAAPGHPVRPPGRAGEGLDRRAGRHPRGAGPGRQGLDQGQPRELPRTPGTPPATRCPAATRSRPRWRRSSRRSRRCSASSSRAPTTPRRRRSCPRRSRARAPTSTPPAGSSRAT